MQLKAQRRMNQQLPVRLPSYRWCECTKLQHVSISCGWENECWRQWREIPQRWQQGHTWKVLPLQHARRLSPCLYTYCFPRHTWNKNDLDNALLRFVLQKSRDENFIPGLPVHLSPDIFNVTSVFHQLWQATSARQHFFPCESVSGQSALRNPLEVSICSFERFQNIWFFNLMHTQKNLFQSAFTSKTEIFMKRRRVSLHCLGLFENCCMVMLTNQEWVASILIQPFMLPILKRTLVSVEFLWDATDQ